MANEIAPKNPNQIAEINAAFDAVGATGLENVTAADLLIPRLTIIQGLSPQVIKGKSEYDPDVRVGDIYDVGMQERFPDGAEFLPAHFVKVWIEWKPNRGGLVAVHETDKVLDDVDPQTNTLPNGNVVNETMQFYGINLTTTDRRKTFIPMSITQLKKGKRLLSLAMAERTMRKGIEVTPPLFWRSYFLTTVPESNAMGNWMGWKVERGPLLQDRDGYQAILKEVKDLRDAVVEGRAIGDLGGGEEQSGKGAF